MTAKKAPARKRTMADKADIHDLYERAVQNVEHEVEFAQATFEKIRGRKAYRYREDFCGTASASCQWVRQGKRYHAIGVDIDPTVLDWGRRNRVARLPASDRSRVRLLESDVMTVKTAPVDIVAALNFSYFIFVTRDAMRDYFARARAALVDDGVFFIDLFGGSQAQDEMKERTKHKGFTYIWDQAEFHPVTHHIRVTFTSTFPMARSARRRSPTNGAYGRRRNCANCCWRQASARPPCTGKARTRTAKRTVSSRRMRRVRRTLRGSPISSPSGSWSAPTSS